MRERLDALHHVTAVCSDARRTVTFYRGHGLELVKNSHGLLLELATDAPGFSVDEPAESLEETLSLPEWLEPEREAIEESLAPIG